MIHIQQTAANRCQHQIGYVESSFPAYPIVIDMSMRHETWCAAFLCIRTQE
jgi:hypothetical protein